MRRRKILRGVSLGMLAIAVVFVACALQNPQLGHTVYLGPFAFGAEAWRVLYILYLLVMAGLFAASLRRK